MATDTKILYMVSAIMKRNVQQIGLTLKRAIPHFTSIKEYFVYYLNNMILINQILLNYALSVVTKKLNTFLVAQNQPTLCYSHGKLLMRLFIHKNINTRRFLK